MRARYYHVQNDSKLLKSGDSYDKLLRAFVIFITSFDPFGRDRMVYTVRNTCIEEPDLEYDDGAVTLFLYTRGKRTTESPALEQLLKYMEHTDQSNAVDEKLLDIQRMVDSIKTSSEAKRADMKFHEILARERSEGHSKGYEEGREAERQNYERERQNYEQEIARLKDELEKTTSGKQE